MTFEEEILDALKAVYDPEIRVNIVDLGLVYSVVKEEGGIANIKMTLTTPGCPMSEQIMRDVKFATGKHPEVEKVEVELVWSPPWDRSMMSEEARLMLNM